MNTAVLFSSATDEWSTPRLLYRGLDAEFRFSLDAAARRENTTSTYYLGPDNLELRYRDGLTADWLEARRGIGSVFCNPPYARGLQVKFIAKAARERLRGVLTVMLLPARTDTKAFHAHCYDASRWQPREGIEIRLLPGRLKFGGASNSAPFPSMLVIFRPNRVHVDPPPDLYTPSCRSIWESGEKPA